MRHLLVTKQIESINRTSHFSIEELTNCKLYFNLTDYGIKEIVEDAAMKATDLYSAAIYFTNKDRSIATFSENRYILSSQSLYGANLRLSQNWKRFKKAILKTKLVVLVKAFLPTSFSG